MVLIIDLAGKSILLYQMTHFFQSARGQAHSKTLPRQGCDPKHRVSVLDCGGPPPLFFKQNRFSSIFWGNLQ